MTQKQLTHLCRVWQKRLRLQDWNIRPQLLPKILDSDGSELLGSAPHVSSEMEAIIQISEDHPSDEAIESTLVHELLHLRLTAFHDQTKTTDEQETTINVLAAILMGAFKRRKREKVPQS